MTNTEINELIDALIGMCDQYLKIPKTNYFAHKCMQAGEAACDILVKLGIADEIDNGFKLKEKFLTLYNNTEYDVCNYIKELK